MIGIWLRKIITTRRRRKAPRILAAACLSAWGVSCSSLHQSTKEEAFKSKFGDYTYCEIEAVRQTSQKSCGLACLAAVLRYWDRPASEPELARSHPLKAGIGYPMQQLQAIAVGHGLLAFAVSMAQTGDKPAAALAEHLARGRPVIVAIHCPQGRYFGEPVPIIESLDRRTWRPLGIGTTFKHHYVVVIGENATNYLVMDPAYGIGSVRKQSLLDWWRGESYAALICSPPPAIGSG
ncbi:MAG: cysteine peptidase family C39 domain-containing protein [Verrucomicrobiales bacterium]